MVSKYLMHDFVKESVSTGKKRKHKKLFSSNTNSLDPEHTARDQNTIITYL